MEDTVDQAVSQTLEDQTPSTNQEIVLISPSQNIEEVSSELQREKTEVIDTIQEEKNNENTKQSEELNVHQIDSEQMKTIQEISEEKQNKESSLSNDKGDKLVSDSFSTPTNQEVRFDTKSENIEKVSDDLQRSQQKDEINTQIGEKESKTELKYPEKTGH